jgi:hypothetical protein
MGIERVVEKDKEKQSEKYLLLLDYLLVKLKTGRPSGISFNNILKEYRSEMGTTLDGDEQREFWVLHEGKYFEHINNSIDRIKLTGKAKEYFNQSSLVNREMINDNNKPHATPPKKITRGEWWMIILTIIMLISMYVIAEFI